MYISPRATRVRTLLVSTINGGITLIILLIAPLGLAAVIINTLLVTVATYAVSSVADRVIAWLLPPTQAELLSQSNLDSMSLRRQQRLESLMERRRQ
ncbi:hypothetical protein H6F96_19355 [Microcoleus sp. FACHB-53]|nr:hypothetical protein [Microcoleus sp. FACHB-53]